MPAMYEVSKHKPFYPFYRKNILLEVNFLQVIIQVIIQVRNYTLQRNYVLLERDR